MIDWLWIAPAQSRAGCVMEVLYLGQMR